MDDNDLEDPCNIHTNFNECENEILNSKLLVKVLTLTQNFVLFWGSVSDWIKKDQKERRREKT